MNTLLQQPVRDSPRTTVFDIPLLVDLIAQHLINLDLCRCSLVSRQFRDAFQHRLYTCISIEHETTHVKFFCKESVIAFSRHRSNVREVSTPLGRSIIHLVKEAESQRTLRQAQQSTRVLFRNLTVFRYLSEHALIRPADLKVYSASILLLLETSPALQVLHLSCFADKPGRLLLRLAKIIRRRGSRLKHFCIEGPQRLIDDTVFYTLLWSCAAVEVLHMGFGPKTRPPTAFAKSLPIFKTLAREARCNSGPGTHSAQSEATDMVESSQDTDRIEFAWKELGPGVWLNDPELEMVRELLQKCPFLERMVFPKLIEQDVITHLAPVVVNSMRQLRHLDLTHFTGQPQGSCTLIQSCNNLISLTLGKLQFNPTLLVDAVVLGHGHSLQSLNIERSKMLTSQQLNLILSNCPRLLSLHAQSFPRTGSSPVLDTKDLARVPEEPGWGCKDLETLHLCYNVETTIGIPEVLWRQIGQLSKLTDLRIRRHTLRQVPPSQEKESVRQALSSWKVLSNLKQLELAGMDAFVDEAVVDEVRRQWSQLEWVRRNID
ncbi:hypothetical protein BGZ68_001508 [Mortierella alpina]|nr:hypothetical protein BGZ68_001508 [Mortierella alpina]